jgi:acetyl esterase
MNHYQHIDPSMRQFLEELVKHPAPPLSELTLEQARSTLQNAQEPPPKLAGISVHGQVIPVGAFRQLKVEIVQPEEVTKPLPVVLLFHGGGWVLGDHRTHRRLAADLAVASQAAVVSVDFPRSPEARFPTALEECYAAIQYLAEHGQERNLDRSNMAVAGDSAGGNLATALCLLAAERGGPVLRAQVLLYPTTDANFDTPSYREFGQGYFLTKEDMQWFWDQYIPDHRLRIQAHASPLHASLTRLRQLPPAFIAVAEFDVLREEGEAYAHKLIEAGVEVTAVRVLGAIHGFATLNAFSSSAPTRSLLQAAGLFLRQHLQREGKHHASHAA